jgi:hypothetical protein
MRFSASNCADGLARTLATIGEEIEPDLHLVSQAALDEWRTLQSRWRPAGAGEQGEQGEQGEKVGPDPSPDLSEEEFEALEAKARRFRDIVRSLAPQVRVRRDQAGPSSRVSHGGSHGGLDDGPSRDDGRDGSV